LLRGFSKTQLEVPILRRKAIEALRDFPELPASDDEPTVVLLKTQAQIFAEIPDERRGIFLALASLG
jgi:hypothetical protein